MVGGGSLSTCATTCTSPFFFFDDLSEFLFEVIITPMKAFQDGLVEVARLFPYAGGD